MQKDGTWTFDGQTVRIVPGADKSVSLLRRTLGEVAVPLGALAGASYEAGRKSGRLRLRLRADADPLLRATGGKLEDASDPYQLAVDSDRSGVAEYFAEEVRNALLLDQVPSGPCDRYLLDGPALPVMASAGDGTASFDGARLQLEWNWKTEESKKSGGPRSLDLAEIEAVEWQPSVGLEDGHLRFVVSTASRQTPPKYDPHAVVLYGFRKDPLMALVAAAVTARLPHPAGPAVSPAPAASPELADPVASPLAKAGSEATGEDHDALLRRLRELGELLQAGVLTEEEFTAAKQAVLARF